VSVTSAAARFPSLMSNLIASPQDFGNDRFLRSSGPLRYLAAREAVVCVGSYDNEYEVCMLVLGRDGSIYLSCPKFPHSDGVVIEAKFAVPNGLSQTVDFRDHGYVTTHKVKYSHHASGVVQFSGTGKVSNEVRRRSFVLRESMGRLFQLSAYWPSGFQMLERRIHKNRVYLRNKFPRSLPSGIVISAEWRRKHEVAAQIRPIGSTTGPLSLVQEVATGTIDATWLLGAPEGFGIDTHVLMVRCFAVAVPPGITDPTVVFLGGWDPHETSGLGQRVEQTGCLAFMYPVASIDQLRSTMGTIDLVSPTVV
jgi:hypothetical protein